MDGEVSERIAAGTRCIHSLVIVLNNRKITRKTKLRIYSIIIRPIVLYGCEAWTLTKERMRRLEFFENGMLRKILGAVYDHEKDRWRRRHTLELRELT